MSKHQLIKLESLPETGDRRKWAGWWCACGAADSGYRFALEEGGALCGAANEWAVHAVVALAGEVVYNSQE